jgi:hypothetical protein
MSRLLRFALPFGLFLAVSHGVAKADETGQDPRVAAAKTACAAGDYQQSVRLLAELYTATNDPIWIFNQGRCYHQNNQFPQAIARFKEFLRKNVGGPAEDSRDAQSYINEIEAEMHKADEKLGEKKAEPKMEQPGGLVTASMPAPSGEGRGLRYAGIGGFALAGVALVSGVIFTLLKQKAESDVESQTKGTVPYSQISGRMSDGETYATLQWVGYGVGAGALVAGGILYYLGSSRAASAATPVASPATALAPFWVADGGGLVVVHSF